MPTAALWIAATLGLASPPDPNTLVARLGAPKFAERERASAELERIGRLALPPLREAAGSRDPEIRDRAAILIDRIERQRLTRPTTVTLNFRDVPIEQALEALDARSGLSARVDSLADPSWKAARVTLLTTEPIPYWQALDRICRAGTLRQAPPLPVWAERNPAAIRLVPGDPEALATSYSGPFRVRLMGLRRQKAPAGSAGPGTVFARIEAVAEPGLGIIPAGPLKLLGAVDERDQAMFPARPTEGTNASGGPRQFDESTPIVWEVPLRLPDRPGTRIERLRGEVPVSIGARQPVPATSPLEGVEGKVFHVGDATVRIFRNLAPVPDRVGVSRVSIEISRSTAPADIPPPPGFRNGRPMPISGATERLLKQVEFVDAQGRRCEKVQQGGGRDFSGVERVIFVVKPSQGANGGAPAEVRVHDVIQATSEISFDFSKVPLP